MLHKDMNDWYCEYRLSEIVLAISLLLINTKGSIKIKQRQMTKYKTRSLGNSCIRAYQKVNDNISRTNNTGTIIKFSPKNKNKLSVSL